jgi:hypothetical protein
MAVENAAHQPYMVSIYETNEAPGSLKFTFVPKQQGQRPVAGAPKHIPQHIVRVSEISPSPDFDWTESPDAPGDARDELEEIARERLEERHKWLDRVGKLVGDIELWGEKLGWATRRIEKHLEDSGVGAHKVPALLLQKETVRVLLEPVSPRALGAEGIVDLYLMPSYDDIASLYFREGRWRVHYIFQGRGEAAAMSEEVESQPLSEDIFAAVLEEMKKHGQ